MSPSPLDRTLRLLRGDLFPAVGEAELEAVLRKTRVVLRADSANLAEPAAQSALVASFICLAQLGFEIFLDAPGTRLLSPQPPLSGTSLGDALLELGDDLITSPSRSLPEGPLATVLLGDTPPPADEGGVCLRLGGDQFGARLALGAEAAVPRFRGRLPFGATLGAAALAAELLRLVLSRFAERRRLRAPGEFDLGGPRPVALALPPLELPEHLDLGQLDVVSAGAITNGALFNLYRVEGLRASGRLIDSDRAELTNLNRYPLLRRSQLDRLKVELLAELAGAGFEFEAVPLRLGDRAEDLGPLAGRVLIGADDIPARWEAQRRARGWVGVGATSHFTALVSAHTPETPCAGCLHPADDPDAPAALPTISFTSLLAGTLLAHRLLASLGSAPPAPPQLLASFNLSAPRALAELPLAANPRCPVPCAASRRPAGARG